MKTLIKIAVTAVAALIVAFGATAVANATVHDDGLRTVHDDG